MASGPDRSGGRDEEYLRVARSQLESVVDHCEAAREQLTAVRSAVEAGNGRSALREATTGDTTLVDACRAVAANTFDPLHRQLSKLVVTAPAAAEDLSTDRLEETVTELYDHHDRLMAAVGDLSELAGERYDRDRTLRTVDRGLRAMDHVESSVELIECLLAKSATGTAVPTIDRPGSSADYEVHGTITHGGDPLADVTVRAFDVDLRGREPLGEATTDDDGRYRITYREPDFRSAEHGSADVEVRVYDAADAEIDTSGIVFNVDPEATVDVAIDGDVSVDPSEYARLRAELAPVLDGASLADLSDTQRSFLARELDLEGRGQYPAGRRSLAVLATAVDLGERTPFTPQVVYGIGRRLDRDVDREYLAGADPQTLADRIDEAVRADVVRLDTTDLLDRVREARDRLATRLEFEAGEQQRVTIDVRRPDGRPLPGYGVHVEDAGDDRRGGQFVTDGSGRTGFSFVAPPDGGGRTFDVSVINDVGRTVHEQRVTVEGDSQRTVEVADPGPGYGGASTLQDVGFEADSSLPVDALPETSLSSVRQAGGVGSLDVGPAAGTSSAEAADGLATLDLTTRPAASAALVSRGYTSQVDVAGTPRGRFRSELSGELGDAGAGVVHTRAVAQAAMLDSVLTGRRTALRSGTRRGDAGDGTDDTGGRSDRPGDRPGDRPDDRSGDGSGRPDDRPGASGGGR